MLFIVIIWLSTVPKILTGEDKLSVPRRRPSSASAHFPAVRDTVLGRCSMCHAAEPSYEGIYRAPKGVMLETDAAIADHAREIYLQAGRSHAMPPGNVTQITPQERALLVAWFEGAARSEARVRSFPLEGRAGRAMTTSSFAAAPCPSCAGPTARDDHAASATRRMAGCCCATARSSTPAPMTTSQRRAGAGVEIIDHRPHLHPARLHRRACRIFRRCR